MQVEIAQTRLEAAREQRKAASDSAEFTQARARERFWESKLEEIKADSGGKPKSQRDCKMPHSELSKKGKLKCPGCGANIGQVEKKVEEAGGDFAAVSSEKKSNGDSGQAGDAGSGKDFASTANTDSEHPRTRGDFGAKDKAQEGIYDEAKHPRGRGGKWIAGLRAMKPGETKKIGGVSVMRPEHGEHNDHFNVHEGTTRRPGAKTSVGHYKPHYTAEDAAAHIEARRSEGGDPVRLANMNLERYGKVEAFNSNPLERLPKGSPVHQIGKHSVARLSDGSYAVNGEHHKTAAAAAKKLREAADSMAKASTPEPFSTSTTSNWVARGGGLPAYIQHIAHDIHEKRGKSVSNAIQIAIGVVKRWAKGVGNVDAGTRAAAAKAVAEWEKLKAGAHAKSGGKALAAAHIQEAAQQGACAACGKKLKRPNQVKGPLVVPDEATAYDPANTCPGCGFTTAVLAAMVEDDEARLVDAEAAALVEALSDLDEVAVWDPEKHPRQRGGRFADVLGKLSHQHRGELSRRIAGFNQRAEIVGRAGDERGAATAKRQADSLRVHLRGMGPTRTSMPGSFNAHPGHEEARPQDTLKVRSTTVNMLTGKVTTKSERVPMAPEDKAKRTDGRGPRTDERTSVEPTPGEMKNAIRKAWDMHPGIDYSVVSRLRRKHKSNLTRAKNSGDHQKVIDVADAALADFENHGYPDDWALFERARQDAQFAQRRDADYHPGFGGDTESDQLQRQIDSGQRGRRTEPDVNPADLPPPQTIPDRRDSKPDTPAVPEGLADMPLNEIARHIERDWGQQGKGVNYAAKPYLAALHSLGSVDDNYGMDDGRMIVAYFLSNARSWKGPTAKAVKAELKRRTKR